MQKVTILRTDFSAYGTFGILHAGPFRCLAVERTWLNNQRKVSCIPEGVYTCKWGHSPKYGWRYQVMEVPSRSDILIHPGNYPKHSQGCILLAKYKGVMAGLPAGLVSKPIVSAFNSLGGKLPFTLEVINAGNFSSFTK